MRDITSLGGFLASLMDSAKGWQDNLQSTLPGYRERIVHVALDDAKEGGLNLTMSKETIGQLVKYGREAGQAFAGVLSFLRDHVKLLRDGVEAWVAYKGAVIGVSIRPGATLLTLIRSSASSRDSDRQREPSPAFDMP